VPASLVIGGVPVRNRREARAGFLLRLDRSQATAENRDGDQNDGSGDDDHEFTHEDSPLWEA
jgi:hypothetical protein